MFICSDHSLKGVTKHNSKMFSTAELRKRKSLKGSMVQVFPLIFHPFMSFILSWKTNFEVKGKDNYRWYLKRKHYSSCHYNRSGVIFPSEEFCACWLTQSQRADPSSRRTKSKPTINPTAQLCLNNVWRWDGFFALIYVLLCYH